MSNSTQQQCPSYVTVATRTNQGNNMGDLAPFQQDQQGQADPTILHSTNHNNNILRIEGIVPVKITSNHNGTKSQSLQSILYNNGYNTL